MKIIHYCLSNFYIDGMNYQENALIREHVKAGHDVLVIASTENMDADKKLTYAPPGEYIGEEGARVIRLPYRGWPHAIAKKLRIHPNVYKLTEEFAPDAMMFHSMCGWELRTVARYARKNPDVIFYADSHEDRHNSAQGFVSREILHKRYYAPIARSAIDAIRKVLCVNMASMEFMRDVYGLPEDKIEFFPLAGNPMSAKDIAKTRDKTRKALSLSDSHTVIVQSGKQTLRKKLLESLRAFSKTDNIDARFLIIGVLQDDIKSEADALISVDDRIEFLGWKTANELNDILCAADIYLQPGTQSATMQNSLCAGCAIILDDVPSHAPYFVENGWLVSDQVGLKNALKAALDDRDALPKMQSNSLELAHDLLDYTSQAQRILR